MLDRVVEILSDGLDFHKTRYGRHSECKTSLDRISHAESVEMFCFWFDWRDVIRTAVSAIGATCMRLMH